MKYIKITRNDTNGFYVQPVPQLCQVIDGELLSCIDDLPAGTSVTMEVVEMSEEKYSKLPEFTGW